MTGIGAQVKLFNLILVKAEDTLLYIIFYKAQREIRVYGIQVDKINKYVKMSSSSS